MQSLDLRKITALFLFCAATPGVVCPAQSEDQTPESSTHIIRRPAAEEPVYQDEFFETQEYFANLSYGASLGIRAIGHFGQAESILAPRGGFAVEPSAFVWYKHLVQLRGSLGFAFSDPRFFYGSVGGRATILEVIADNQSEHKGIHGGLILQALDSFLLYASVDLNIIHFPNDPLKPYAFNGTAFSPAFGAGVEVRLYKGKPGDEIHNAFINLGASYFTVQGSKYLSPVISIGAEVR